MLSKSGAKIFFIGGTVFFGAIFVALSYDTLKQVPARTHTENLSPQVAAGKKLWDRSNCMGCHTILGEGAYYAPELTQVYNKRGADMIRQMLTDPEKLFPGQRKMRKYDFTDEQKESLVAFLKWIGEIDTNGFPAKPVNE